MFSWRRSLPGGASHNLFILFFFGTALSSVGAWCKTELRALASENSKVYRFLFCFVVVFVLLWLVISTHSLPLAKIFHLVLNHLLALCTRSKLCLREAASAVLIRYILKPSVSELTNACIDNVFGNGRMLCQVRPNSPCQTRDAGLHILGIG